jgi:glycosyltransferase involved in cell wall biosynthesis
LRPPSASAPLVAPLDFRQPPVPRLVSCIVPVFNGERFVADAVESLLAQTYSQREVIVVDDGSDDGTLGVLARFGDQIRVLRQANAGPSGARNHGMEESRGAFVAFLDADDIWVEDKLELQMAVFEAHPEIQLCSGHIKSFWVPELDHERRAFEDHPYHRERALLSPCTVLVRRELFQHLGGFDPDLRNAEDTDWFHRMLKAGIAYDTLPRLLVHRRQHTANLTRTVRPSHDATLARLKRTLDRHRGQSGRPTE